MERLGDPWKGPRPTAAADRLWGDGFATDGLLAACSLTDWADCSPDEYAMVFPRLLSSGRALADPLLRHLEACVAVRAWRLKRLDPEVPAVQMRSKAPEGVDPAALHRAWFADDRAVACLLRQLGLLRTSPERVASERRLLAFLDATLDLVQRGLDPVWSEDGEAWFAFGSGIHPAYLWPESAISPDRGCTAAWLGHLDRGRTALMPLAVAEYLTDAVLDPAGSRDGTLAAMMGPAEAPRLRHAAARRFAGGDPKVAFGRGRHRRLAAVGEVRPGTSVRKDALEHA